MLIGRINSENILRSSTPPVGIHIFQYIMQHQSACLINKSRPKTVHLMDPQVAELLAGAAVALWRCCTCRTCVHCRDLTEIPEILRRFSPPLASKGNFEGFPSKTNNWILIKLHVSTTCNKSKSSYDVSSFSCSECGIEMCSFNHQWKMISCL